MVALGDFKVVDENGQNALHYLFKNKNLMLKHFIYIYDNFKDKLDFIAKDNKGNTCLMVMMQNKFIPSV